MSNETKKYEIINYGSDYQIGTILTENQISPEELQDLIKAGIAVPFKEELLFD